MFDRYSVSYVFSLTTGAVTGALAGLHYRHHTIPPHWLTQLARKNDIENLAEKLAKKFPV